MSQRVLDTIARVARKTVGSNESFQVPDCGPAEFDASHGSEFFECDDLPRARFLESSPGAVERAWDAVQDLDHCAGVNVGVVDGS